MIIYRPQAELTGKRLSAHTIASLMFAQSVSDPADLDEHAPMQADLLQFLLRRSAVRYWTTANNWLRNSPMGNGFHLTPDGLQKVRDRLEGRPKREGVTVTEVIEALQVITGVSKNEQLDEFDLGIPGNLDSEDTVHLYPGEMDADAGYTEGTATKVLVNRFERSTRARRDFIRNYGAACSVCGFDFSLRYGALGEGFIHVHHVTPLAEIGEAYVVDGIADLRPVCPNCHAMLHTGKETLSINAIKALLTGS